MEHDKKNLSDCYQRIYNNVKHHADIQNNSYNKSVDVQNLSNTKHCVDSKTQHDDCDNIEIQKMTKFPALSKAIKFKIYTNEDENASFIFVLSQSAKQQNKPSIFYNKIKDGDEKSWQQDWKNLEIDSDVIDFCFGPQAGVLFVARKGQHIEQFKLDKDANEFKKTLFKTIEEDLEISQITLLHSDLVMVLALTTP